LKNRVIILDRNNNSIVVEDINEKNISEKFQKEIEFFLSVFNNSTIALGIIFTKKIKHLLDF